MSNGYRLVPLIDRQDLSRKCIELLNEEWPRSDGSREYSQSKSTRSEPPMSFLMIDKDDSLIGHARVCLLPNRKDACWVESVIVTKSQRGNGLGKLLMTSLEREAKKFGFSKVYLSTDDQVAFYKRCGYVECDPILHSTTATSVFPVLEKMEDLPLKPKSPVVPKEEDPQSRLASSGDSSAPPPPPPPPPPKPSASNSINYKKKINIWTTDHQYMVKSI